MHQNHPNYQTPDYASDEIDLLELIQTLWQEKILIILCTLFVAGGAAVYAFTAQSVYSLSMTIKPAPLSLYGELVAGMENKEKQSVAFGRATAEQVLIQLKNSLELRANQAYLNDTHGVLDFKVSGNAQQITIQLTTTEPTNAGDVVNDYLKRVSKLTVKELNSFMQGLGNKAQVTEEMLYTVDTPAPQHASQIKPKKNLVVAVGVVLGGFLGVFAALMRNMYRKHKETSRNA